MTEVDAKSGMRAELNEAKPRLTVANGLFTPDSLYGMAAVEEI